MNILDRMKANDKFIGDILAPFEKAFGMKFNKIQKPEDVKFVEPKKKNMKAALRKAEKKQEKLKDDPLAAKKATWKRAMDKAEGVKVQDDPKIIRKVLKRKQAEKKKSKKQWAERVEKQKNAMKAKNAKKAKNRARRRK